MLKDEITKRFENCDDFVLRTYKNGYICYIKGITSRDVISRCILRPLLYADAKKPLPDILTSGSLRKFEGVDSTCDALVRGEALVVYCGEACLCNVQDEQSRSVGQPESDVTLKGPKTGFIEDCETNLSLLRRYIRSSRFKSESFVCGSETRTKVCMCYIDGRADGNVVEMIRNRLNGIKAVSIVDSGNIAVLLSRKKGFPFFPITGSSEKVDKVASKLVAGRVAVICDGSPFVLTMPYVFAESIQSAEDYLRSAWYATFMRCLRFISLLIAIMLPAVYLCTKRSADTLTDLLVTLIIFELLREVGVRMPRSVGDAVGIVGSLLIGDAAVQAGLTEDECIIIVAMSAVCAFIVPVYMYDTTLLRFVFIAAAFLFGFAGVSLVLAVVTAALCGTVSFGSHYMSPLSPFKKQGMMDFLLAVPDVTLGRKERP